jgi:hypothetical protein
MTSDFILKALHNAPLGLVDPDFDQAGGRHILILPLDQSTHTICYTFVKVA